MTTGSNPIAAAATTTKRSRKARVGGIAMALLLAVGLAVTSLLAFNQNASARTQRVGLPVPRAATNLHNLTKPHHDYPAADIPVPKGTGVHAVLGGTVTYAGGLGSCGNAVIIQNGNRQDTYCHNTSVSVRAGQVVAPFDRIASAGSTGHSSGPHVHLQIKINGQLRCPQPLLKAAWYNQSYDPQNLPAGGCSY